MTTDERWHAGPELLHAYAAGRLDPVGQAALETHVDRCADCRAAARTVAAPAALAPVWDAVLAEVRTPPQPRPLRLGRGSASLRSTSWCSGRAGTSCSPSASPRPPRWCSP